MKKAYETPTVERNEFNYRDQIVVASAGAAAPMENGSGNIFNSSEFNGCYDLGDVGEYLLESWLGNCSWING